MAVRALSVAGFAALVAACASPVPTPSSPSFPTPSQAVTPSPASAPSHSVAPQSSPTPSALVVPLNATAEARDARFRLTLRIDRERYRAGEPIEAGATLTFLGPEAAITASGSGSGLVLIALEQLDGPLDPHGAGQDDCRPFDLRAGQPVEIHYVKSGGWDADGRDAAWYAAFFKDPTLRLPPGVWQLTAYLDAFIGEPCAIDGERHQLQTAVTFQVVD